MPLVVKDRVRETTTTLGTGTVTLAGAVAGFQSFSAIGNANTTYYTINLPGANEWEVGLGTYTASGTTLSRDTILASSNGGSAVNFSAGTKDVFCTYPAGKSAYLDAANNLLIGTTTNTNTSNIVANGTISETVSSTQYLVASQYDVGTNPNQIPLNQYLGDMAFQSSAGVSVGNLTAVNAVLTNPLLTTYGGTGLSSYTAGDITYYASGTALTKLGIGTANRVLTSSGSAPQWVNTLTGLTSVSATTFTENGYAVVTQADIGSGANEIPLNQYLGSMAYQNGDSYYNIGMTVGFRNRIINGAMQIDQRNAGASVTPSTNGAYLLDRWQYGQNSVSGKFSVQQSSTAPSGFNNSMIITSNSAYSVGSSDIQILGQSIEGLNCADLAWGTSSAKTITVSFWVRSSLTGNFGAVIRNADDTRCYPFLYTINAANTWEYKTQTIPGDTTGTWNTNTSIGVRLAFSMGTGSTYSGPPGAWAGTAYYSATGGTNLTGTNGATWYVTGVQIEVGDQATPFDWRPYGTELQLCQRYFEKISFATDAYTGTSGWAITSGAAYFGLIFSVDKRATPTLAASGTFRGQGLADTNDSSTYTLDATANKSGRMILNAAFAGTNGQAVTLQSRSSGAYIQASAEL